MLPRPRGREHDQDLAQFSQLEPLLADEEGNSDGSFVQRLVVGSATRPGGTYPMRKSNENREHFEKNDYATFYCRY